nr:hypothetical protein [Tanacetum cinerariifolium]
MDLLVQQYEQFTILKEESIDGGFARFNTIITSLKALDEGFSSKNYVMKFLRTLHPKWRAKFTAIEESKDLSSLGLDELIGNLKKKGKFVMQPIEEKKSFRQKDEKKGNSDRKCFRCGDPNHLIGDCPKLPRNKDQKVSLEVLESIVKMTSKTKLTMKLVSWLNRQMSKASTSGTKPISFVGSSAENATDGSTIKVLKKW